MTAGLGYDFLLMRLDANGVRDPSFGTNGVATTRFPGSTGDNLGRKLVLQPDGKIVLVGGVPRRRDRSTSAASRASTPTARSIPLSVRAGGCW